ncbi:serine hydrolase domain-containing protein [Staphylococcus epidermidis]|uniref:serine hydrolase domain-containing protein n=1 Tax=Staphylococcus epidermidis TaxID=1282 RepID=UPI001E44527E|nr:serine hydrolase domain-containing protein [Staphylococcus epidermidis]MCD8923620.1 beta-lactamase family protein [Staphylococcus epidermidis]MCD9057271.1 beta-lactamase family protein [Staphylococcus epidermidis]MEB5737849.1 beta-lactamase family protein [Staphylococcus epidermidis]MEB7071306.1 beta-lactamase family protein [Staphylococcus epidermidis]MEB7387172.1 beta-lactamase family protein [Staphylococcus epidermidis]
MKIKLFVIVVIFLMTILSIISITTREITHSKNETILTHASQKHIDKMVETAMKKGDIPGLAILIIKDNKIFLNKGYGYANIEKKAKVNPHTQFEIASNTKAFTGYAILQLAQEGKINLNDKVSTLIPGFKMKYEDKENDITIEQLLAQTSGIPGYITEENRYSKQYDSIENIVNFAKGKRLNHAPGETFEYSNMNYDILGLIIQNVTHQSYTSYIQKHVLAPLKMKHTTFKVNNTKANNEALGYIWEDNENKVAQPEFNIGDTPAAYMMSSTSDLAKWVQLQIHPTSKSQAQLIRQSHQVLSNSLNSEPNADSYGSGWFINTDDHLVLHTGVLDNFSSQILLNIRKSYGIVVLANTNSSQVTRLAEHLNTQIMNNRHYTTIEEKVNQTKNMQLIISTLADIFMVIFSILVFSKILKLRDGHIFIRKCLRTSIMFSIILLGFVAMNILFYLLPLIILGDATWGFVLSWLPLHSKYLVVSVYLAITMLLIWLSLLSITYHSDENKKHKTTPKH